MVGTEAPAARRKPPATATPSTYGHRARRRLYLLPRFFRCRSQLVLTYSSISTILNEKSRAPCPEWTGIRIA
jgi:hypothetical protein